MRALNDRGDVVARRYGPTGTFFLSRNGVQHDLGVRPWVFDDVKALNERGEVLGVAHPGPGKDSRPVVWRDGRVYDLNALLPPGGRRRLDRASLLNQRGQIAGGRGPPRRPPGRVPADAGRRVQGG